MWRLEGPTLFSAAAALRRERSHVSAAAALKWHEAVTRYSRHRTQKGLKVGPRRNCESLKWCKMIQPHRMQKYIQGNPMVGRGVLQYRRQGIYSTLWPTIVSTIVVLPQGAGSLTEDQLPNINHCCIRRFHYTITLLIHENCAAPTRQHELDQTDQEQIYLP